MGRLKAAPTGAMGYFAPPSHETWRLVDAASTADSLTIDWLPPNALATTWGVSVRSVIAKRRRTGAPDVTEAMAEGLMPPLDDGELVIDAKAEIDGDWFFGAPGPNEPAYGNNNGPHTGGGAGHR